MFVNDILEVSFAMMRITIYDHAQEKEVYTGTVEYAIGMDSEYGVYPVRSLDVEGETLMIGIDTNDNPEDFR